LAALNAVIRHRAASLALGATVLLTVIKLSVAFFSGSVGVLSEGIHSFLDVVSAALAFFTVREAGKPADEDHPFGHGKIETLSSLFEALLLVVAAGIIIFEGVNQLQNPEPIHHTWIAMGTIGFSIAVSYYVYKNNIQAARKTESSALTVNSLHFLSDVVASVAILVGLVLLKLTGKIVIDALMAFAVAAYILVVSAKQVKEALLELSDKQLPEIEIRQIREILETFKEKMIEAHDLRTRRSGATRHVDFHLVVCRYMTVETSHAVCDEMESELLAKFPNASVNIHVEPCEIQITHCNLSCPLYPQSDPKLKGAQIG
jgi:cation diffusion facilitator family transporter